MGARDVLVRPVRQVGGDSKAYAVLCPTYAAQLSKFSGSRVGVGQPMHGRPRLNPTATCLQLHLSFRRIRHHQPYIRSMRRHFAFLYDAGTLFTVASHLHLVSTPSHHRIRIVATPTHFLPDLCPLPADAFFTAPVSQRT
jgi:hypothetical protein